MGVRLRRSVRLFPGVRLNFSRSGVTTTVGVRGATMTLGGHGTHVNVGLPGTGLSYRTRLAPSSSARSPKPEHARLPTPHALPPKPSISPPDGAVEIRSAEVSVLTSAGLGELKRLINEAAVRRRILISQVTSHERALKKARGRLRLARTFIIRLVTAKAVPRLAAELASAEQQLEQSRAELDGCYVEVDFGFDQATLGTYAALARSFEDLSACNRIWDITSTKAVDRVAERTVATTAVSRTPVTFSFTAPAIVRSKYQVMQLGNAGGRDLQIFPGFVMMRDLTQDFGLIEFGEFDMKLSRTRFVEEETVPADSQVIGHTWKKANKDGSPDRRFKENYQIPIAEYGELVMTSPTGLLEAYKFSHYGKTQAFAQAFGNHKRALAASIGTDGPDANLVEPPATEDEPHDSAETPDAPIPVKPAKGLWLDWTALALLVIMFVFCAFWVRSHQAHKEAPAAPVAAAPAAPSPSSSPHHRRHRHRSAATPLSSAQPGEAQ